MYNFSLEIFSPFAFLYVPLFNDISDFLIKHKYKEITTVFPATTTAATTSMQTGLNPIEHGYLGWNMYLSPIDETVELYTGINKETGTPSAKYHEVKKEYLSPKTIVDEINEQNKYHAISLFPFKDTKYKDLDEMISIIEKKCQKEGKNTFMRMMKNQITQCMT